MVAVVLSAVRLGQLMGRRTAKYRLMGAAAWVHRAAAALAAVALLLVLFQLQACASQPLCILNCILLSRPSQAEANVKGSPEC